MDGLRRGRPPRAPRLCSANAGLGLSRARRHALEGMGAAWRDRGRQTNDGPGNERVTTKRVCEAAGYAGEAFRAGYRSRSGRPETSKPSRGAAESCFVTVMAGVSGSKAGSGSLRRKAGGLRWRNAGGDQPPGGGPVSPGSRMTTRARPPLTVTSGAPSVLRPIVTRGLLPGGAGGSAASVVTVPASSMKRIRTVPPVPRCRQAVGGRSA